MYKLPLRWIDAPVDCSHLVYLWASLHMLRDATLTKHEIISRLVWMCVFPLMKNFYYVTGLSVVLTIILQVLLFNDQVTILLHTCTSLLPRVGVAHSEV